MYIIYTVYVSQNRQTRRVFLRERGSAIYDNKTEHLPMRNVCLAKYRQSYKYFSDFEDQLRVDLRFKPSVLEVARKWLEQVETCIYYACMVLQAIV